MGVFPACESSATNRLAAVLSAPEQPSGHRKVALAAIARFRMHEALRTMLCHSVTKVALDRAGQRVAVMTLVCFKTRETTTEKLTLEEDEARTRLEQLIDDRRRVCTAFGQVRRKTS